MTSSLKPYMSRESHGMANELQVISEKTEVSIMKGSYKPGNIGLKVLDEYIIPKKEPCYLDLNSNWKLSFATQVEQVCTKVEKTLAALMKLEPNIGGPNYKKRQIMYEAV